MRYLPIILCVLVAAAGYGQSPGPAAGTPAAPTDPATLLGMDLAAAFAQFGLPRTVRAVRGPDPRQDDVVFSYGAFELYWFRDRVWQVAMHAAYGVRTGDPRIAVEGVLGAPHIPLERALVYQLPTRAWPVRLRVGLSAAGVVESLYVFRADF